MFIIFKSFLPISIKSVGLIQCSTRSFSNKVSSWKNFQLSSSLNSSKLFIPAPPHFLTARFLAINNNNSPHESISSIPLKKRPVRKKKSLDAAETVTPGLFNVLAFATSEEYDLENLKQGLKKQDLYEIESIPDEANVLHAFGKYRVEKEPREIFFFREGGVVLWNITDLESSNILNFLKEFQQDSYSERLVQAESEVMNYKWEQNLNDSKASGFDKAGNFMLYLNCEEDRKLLKYTFSNAMFLSVKLGIWEASLDKYIEEIEDITNDLKRGIKVRLTREEALKKHGELFALRHYLNLSSDVLDTPDFYWENEKLENLYNQVCSYFCIRKRSNVMNEKINHCVALIELISHHLNDKHSTSLEWMIIILIMIEVFFEVIHYAVEYQNHHD